MSQQVLKNLLVQAHKIQDIMRQSLEMRLESAQPNAQTSSVAITSTPRNQCASLFKYVVLCVFFTHFTFTSQVHPILPGDEGKGEGLQQMNANQHAMLDSMLDSMPHHVWIAPAGSLKMEYFNQRWYEYTGIEQHESCTDGGASAIHPDDLNALISSAMMAQTLNHAYSVDVRIRDRNGDYRWFRIRGAPTFDGDQVIAWVGTNTDIDEGRRMRDELEMTHARLARLQAITTRLATALTITDVTAVFVREVISFLQARSGILGLIEPDGHHMRVLDHSGGFEAIETVVRRLKIVYQLDENRPSCDCVRLAEPLLFESPQAMERAYPTLKQAHQTSIQSAAFLPLNGEARPIGVMNLNFDHTTIFTPERLEFMTTIASLIAQALDRARLYDAQREQAEVLERRVQERTRELELHKEELEAFVYTVSHDLRAPLHKLSMSSSLLASTVADNQATENQPAENQAEDVHWLLEGIETGIRHMDQLIRDLLHLSRAGRTPEDPVRVNLGELIDRVIGELEPTIQARGVLVQRPKSWPEVTYPQTELYQIVLNLLGNAVRFAGQSSRPEVKAAWTLEDSNIVLCVEDNGVGIPEEKRGKVFELFAKLDPLSSGTGVGLAIVKRIAERHGGGVEIDGSPLGGARFHVRIPQQKADAQLIVKHYGEQVA
jgi:PAS domain S-box-containing protein